MPPFLELDLLYFVIGCARDFGLLCGVPQSLMLCCKPYMVVLRIPLSLFAFLQRIELSLLRGRAFRAEWISRYVPSNMEGGGSGASGPPDVQV